MCQRCRHARLARSFVGCLGGGRPCCVPQRCFPKHKLMCAGTGQLWTRCVSSFCTPDAPTARPQYTSTASCAVDQCVRVSPLEVSSCSRARLRRNQLRRGADDRVASEAFGASVRWTEARGAPVPSLVLESRGATSGTVGRNRVGAQSVLR